MSTCIPCMDYNHDWCRYPLDHDCVCRCERGKGPVGCRIARVRALLRKALGIEYRP